MLTCLPLSGAGVGSRYDGSYPGSQRIGSCEGKTGDASKFSEEFKTFLGKYWEVQTTVYESASGWLQWAWKTESTDEWSYKKGVEYGWIPETPPSVDTLIHASSIEFLHSFRAVGLMGCTFLSLYAII